MNKLCHFIESTVMDMMKTSTQLKISSIEEWKKVLNTEKKVLRFEIKYKLEKNFNYTSSIFSEKEEVLRFQKIMLVNYNVVLDFYEVEVDTQVNFKETKYEQILFIQN